MRAAAAPKLHDHPGGVRPAGAPARPGPRLRALPRRSAPVGEGRRHRLARLGVDAVGLLTGALIGLFWYPAAALLAMAAAALISRSERD